MNLFIRICIANFLMFTSQFMLFPVLPVVFSEYMEISILSTGRIFLVLTVGMLIVGPIHSYLMDTYRKKYLFVISFAVMAIITYGYYFINKPLELLVYPLIHGMALGIANLLLTTVSIDITVSQKRDKSNVTFGWSTRLGIITGIALGSILYMNQGFNTVIFASLGLLISALFFIFSVHIPFRAPIGSPIFSLDRFILPRTWILFINMVLITFVPGVFIPLIHLRLYNTFIFNGIMIPYFVPIAIGFAFSLVINIYIKRKDILKQVVLGLALMVVSTSLFILSDMLILSIISALLLGIGLSITTSSFLCMFINLPSHCQRGSSNITYLLSWLIGISLGIAVCCYLRRQLLSEFTFQLAMFSATLALIFFITATSPYYKRHCLK